MRVAVCLSQLAFWIIRLWRLLWGTSKQPLKEDDCVSLRGGLVMKTQIPSRDAADELLSKAAKWFFQRSRNNKFSHTKCFEVPPIRLISGVQFETEPHVSKSLFSFPPHPLSCLFFFFFITGNGAIVNSADRLLQKVPSKLIPAAAQQQDLILVSRANPTVTLSGAQAKLSVSIKSVNYN